jgi:plasmid stabilization system protein ParE
MRVRFVAEADEELTEAAGYLSERSVQAAQRLLTDVEGAIRLLRRFPRLGSPLRHNLRRLALKVFPYRIIYRIEGGEIVVYALAHVRRRPGYWRKRIAR